MSRRHRAERREITPDAKFGDLVLAKFMNSLMYDGKKSAAEGIIYGAFDTIQQKTKQDPILVFHEALRNVEQGGVKVDGVTIEDRALKLPAGRYVLQVGKRRFARVTLS